MSNQLTASGSKKTFKGWISRHKILVIIIVFILIAAIAAFFVLPNFFRRNIMAGTQTSYEFIRTVTLSKASLDETVSTTGTVESASTSTVTYSGGSGMSGGSLTVKTLHVSVGDTVKAGDVIVSLDDTNIKNSIANEEENIADRVESALKSLNQAKNSYADAYSEYDDADTAANEALTARNQAKLEYNKAKTSIHSFQYTYDNAVILQEQAGVVRNSAKTEYDTALANYNADSGDSAQTLETAKAAYNDAQEAYNTASQNTQDALNALNEAKKACNFDTYEKAYQTAQTSYDNAVKNLDSLESRVESAEEQVEQAQENYNNSDTSSTLEDLYEQLDNVQLKAETDGKVTALNVSVGGTANGTIATIQSTDMLKISITIQEADINNVSVGMTCRIQSDATDGIISGMLTQIDPVSSQNGSFGAEVTVNDIDTGLLIGMNASVEIILNSTEDCFSVPIDAVGNDENGDFVYRQTGGSGVDMTFEKVYVTLGESNDYYIEIDADELREGDVIRASSDLTQGIETVGGSEENNNPFGSGGFTMPGGNFGGGSGGGMPSGDFGNFGGGGGNQGGGQRPNFSGGSGGGMPSGGGFPG